MKIQNVKMEFVAFESADVIATSGDLSMRWIKPCDLESYSEVDRSIIFCDLHNIYFYDSSSSHKSYSDIEEDHCYQLLPHDGFNKFDDIVGYYLVVSGEGTNGTQITTFTDLYTWLTTYGNQ